VVRENLTVYLLNFGSIVTTKLSPPARLHVVSIHSLTAFENTVDSMSNVQFILVASQCYG
jgi:hypothetical protein